jgi:hypothetical protein
VRRIHDMEELAPSPSSDAFAVSSPASFRGRPTIGRPRTRPSERHFHAPHMKGCTTSFAPNSHRGRRRSDGPRRPCRAPLNLPGSSRCWRQARRPSMRPGGARPRPVGACLQSLQPPFIIKVKIPPLLAHRNHISNVTDLEPPAGSGPSCTICPTSSAAACVDGAAILGCCSPPVGGPLGLPARWQHTATVWRVIFQPRLHNPMVSSGYSLL